MPTIDPAKPVGRSTQLNHQREGGGSQACPVSLHLAIDLIGEAVRHIQKRGHEINVADKAGDQYPW